MLLLHPVMPFVTAEIWAALPPAVASAQGKSGKGGPEIAAELYPAARPACVRPEAAARMDIVREAVSAVRTIRAELNLAPALKLKALIRPQDEGAAEIFEQHRAMIESLARLQSLIIDADAKAPRLSAGQVACGSEIIVLLEGTVDLQAEKLRLDKELAKLEKEQSMLENKLSRPGYADKAPADIVEHDRARVEELKAARAKLSGVREKFA
jgi:valyl-tRNA synthetase